ncbi:flagellar L-ring protein FlgH [Burkholderia sp. MSh2]|uniref:Flagellar L-ring protein n=1 Tax=Burkholderia paludis TaxID=1506587 RepID=A0A6J5E0N6_9BURK|nr:MULTISPECIES: flagellar basal body L-ring protein FlgH [Burkholderia]KEZ01655.1 flagellar L-ring protein FlgH [Burkholderia sp. MSh2]CAB3759863.1 Flagellar L-ring protein [Burkholderia paludis]VWC43800.1 Flagellar basal body L-ring protein [Burkholderia paludis]
MNLLRLPASAVLGMLIAVASQCASAESLYREETYRALTSDQKAYRAGDLLTVKVYEQSSATTSTDTSTQRTNGLNGSISILPSGRQLGGSLAQGGTFDGGGTTQRANKLLATLSVNVKDVLPNGDLVVAGEQTLTVNNEQHKVNLTGRVRPQDISSDNVVLSTRLADAHIDYVGEGDLSDRQKRGWWRKVLDWLGL